MLTHGMTISDPVIWRTWIGIRKRAKRCPEYYSDVKVCQFLQESPLNLLECIGRRESKTHSIDRFPLHDGHYSCGECEECKNNGWKKNIRWATKAEQSRNQKSNCYYNAFGYTRLQADWIKLLGIRSSTIIKRLKLGWTIQRALSTPSQGNCWYNAFGYTRIQEDWVRLSGITHSTIKRRVERGWTIERALTTPDERGNCFRAR